MDGLPFALSVDAKQWILEAIRFSQSDPATTGLLPVLSLSFGYTCSAVDGRVEESFTGDHYSVGWQCQGVISSKGYLVFEIEEQSLFISADDLEPLRSKELVLENVEVGYPIPSDKIAMLLRRRPLHTVAR